MTMHRPHRREASKHHIDNAQERTSSDRRDVPTTPAPQDISINDRMLADDWAAGAIRSLVAQPLIGS